MTMTWIKRLTVGFLMVVLLAGAQPAWAESGTVSRVRAYQTDSWRVWVSSGWHEVTVDGDRDTDLDLYVYNTAGQMLASDDDETDYCVGSFYMARGGYIEVRIRNLGPVYNEYELVIR
jgi:hypothetical protein